jgi:hypothetical protein
MKKAICSLVCFVVLTSITQPLGAWGREGHHLVALIAQNHIGAETKARVQELLGDETLVTVSTWPDEIRRERDETAAWHYVDIPKSAAFFEPMRDCYQPYNNHKGADADHHNCVVDRIDIFARIVADKSQPKATRVEALKFLVHFVGDIHQPMHAIDEAGGGNQIKVVQFGSATCGGDRPCNLHSVWDGGLIEHTKLDEPAYAQRLEALIQAGHLEREAGGRPADWANESHRLAEGALLEPGGLADELYFQQEIGLVDQRLALAGLRLARVLDYALGSD